MNIGTLKRFAKGQFEFLEVKEIGERYQFITQRGVDGRLRASSVGVAQAG